MRDALIAVYVRPEGAYINASDRTTVGVWVGSGNWEFVPTDEPERIGEVILRHAEAPPRVVRHPRRNKFSTLWAEKTAPLLNLAGVKTWKAFAAAASLVHVECGDATTVTPMRRDGRGFSSLADARVQVHELDAEIIGVAVLRAAEIAMEHGAH